MENSTKTKIKIQPPQRLNRVARIDELLDRYWHRVILPRLAEWDKEIFCDEL